MKITPESLRRQLALVAAASLFAVGSWAASQAWLPSQSDLAEQAPVRLADRHPATLAGRMDVRQVEYMDLYGPFRASEWLRIEAGTERAPEEH